MDTRKYREKMTVRRAARESFAETKQFGAQLGGGLFGFLAACILIIPRVIFGLITGFIDLFIVFIGMKNAEGDQIYSAQVRSYFRAVATIILGVGLLEALVSFNIINQFGSGTAFESIAFVIACVFGPLIGLIMAKVDVSIFLLDTASTHKVKVWLGFLARILVVLSYPLVTAVGVQMFVFSSEIEENIAAKEAVFVTAIKDRETNIIRTNAETEMSEAKDKDVVARKAENDKFDAEHAAHLDSVSSQKKEIHKTARMQMLLDSGVGMQQTLAKIDEDDATWQKGFQERKAKAMDQLDKSLDGAYAAAQSKAKAATEEVLNLSPEEVAAMYDSSWCIKRSFSNKLDAMNEVLEESPGKAVVAFIVKLVIAILVLMVILMKVLAPLSVRTFLSAHAQAVAGDEGAKRNLQAADGKSILARERAKKDADEAAKLRDQYAAEERSRQEREANHQRRMLEMAAEEEALRNDQREAEAQHELRLAEIAEHHNREQERQFQSASVQGLLQKWVEKCALVQVAMSEVVKGMDNVLLPKAELATEFESLVKKHLNGPLVEISTIEQALSLVWEVQQPLWPVSSPYPDPRGLGSKDLMKVLYPPTRGRA